MDWSEGAVLALIKEIENNPVLWDAKHPDFKRPSKKDDVLVQMSEKLNRPASEISRKWLSLQATYRQERRKELIVSFRKKKKVHSTWFAYNALNFIAHRYKPRKPINPAKRSRTYYDSTTSEELNEDGLLLGNKAKEKDPRRTDTAPTQNTINDSREYEQNEVNRVEESNWGRSEIEKDEFLIYGEYVATKLKKLDKHSSIVAQHFINKLIFEAELGRYKDSFCSDN